MENTTFYILKITLIAIIALLATVEAGSIKSTSIKTHKNLSTKLSKRSAYDKNWAKSSSYNAISSYKNNFPPYLVFNRKIGAYYPYYKYPSEMNSIRRNTRRT